MEKSDIAISSNGRTVFELAHMNIPSIIISQNDRELTHSFGTEENGFVNLGKYIERETEQRLLPEFGELINNRHKRFKLYERMKRYDFRKNKQKVVSLILKLLE